MRRRILIFALLGGLLLAFAAWRYSPTQVLKRRCDSFFNVISISAKQPSEARHVQALKLGDYLDRNVALAAKELPEEIESPLPSGEVQAIFAAACDACSFIAITERQFEFIGIDGDQATVQAMIKVAVGHPAGDKGFNGTHRIMLSWHRLTQGWVLTKVAWEKTGR